MNIWLVYFPELRNVQDAGLWLNQLLRKVSLETLRQNHPDRPPPEQFTINVGSVRSPLPLTPDERRLVQAFGYILTHQKKSSKRLALMQALHEKYPSEDLSEMLLTYAMHWDPADEAETYGISLLTKHPESLGLRLNLGLLALSQGKQEKLLSLLETTLNWPDFNRLRPQIQANAQNIRSYYSLVSLYAAATGSLTTALYAWAICREAKASPAELNTLSREISRQIQSKTALEELHTWIQACA